MPARTMFYKTLNTFIDDLFAFTIKMPTLHRLATLRDDIIFFVYLYQAWAYKVDYSRVNEFGQGGGDEEGEKNAVGEPLAASADGADVGVKEGKEVLVEKANGGTSSGGGKLAGSARKRKV